MFFRYCTNTISNATKGLGKGIFTVGLSLIGFGVLILAFPQIFAALVAAIFIVIGIGCCATAVKILWSSRRFRHYNHKPDNTDCYRENVQIHIEEHLDL